MEINRSPLQVESEIDAFCEILKTEGARSYLEIGSKFGGSLMKVATSLPVGSLIVSVDLNVNGHRLGDCILELRRMGYKAHLIPGNSMDADTIAKARFFAPYDALFIDGNHKLMYVESDWQNYGPMAKVVAFHDIAWRRASPAAPNRILVPEFWNEIKGDYRHKEIILDPEENAYGIGVLWR